MLRWIALRLPQGLVDTLGRIPEPHREALGLLLLAVALALSVLMVIMTLDLMGLTHAWPH